MDNLAGNAITLKIQRIILKSQEILICLETSIDAQGDVPVEKNSAENLNSEKTDNKENSNEKNNNNINNNNEALEHEHEYTQVLLQERNTLIISLFEEYKKSELEHHIDLLNTMLELDEQLKEKSKTLLQYFTKQLVTLRKGKKSTKAYQNTPKK